jgi:hypothetical protein
MLQFLIPNVEKLESYLLITIHSLKIRISQSFFQSFLKIHSTFKYFIFFQFCSIIISFLLQINESKLLFGSTGFKLIFNQSLIFNNSQFSQINAQLIEFLEYALFQT